MSGTRVRLDKWLWAARFYKTRALAQSAIEGGKVELNEARAKPSKEIKPGDRLALRIGELHREVEVRALSERRGPAAQARLLYAETEESRARREAANAERELRTEPARDLHGRPTKKDRRDLRRARGW
jgi:ribosome-associated heat shock protein Hsp15